MIETPVRIAAIDLGAESGRVLLAEIGPAGLALHAVHQFPSPAVRINGTLRWDVLAIWAEIQAGLRSLSRDFGPPAGIGVDSWGVDYVLTRRGNHRDGEPVLTLPYHYRDERCLGAIERVEPKVGRDEVFAATGVQFMPINTIYQLHEDTLRRPEVLRFADGLLLIADFFNWLLSGVARAEETLASTTQLYDPAHRRWATSLAEKLSIPATLLPPVVPAGTVLGPVRSDLRDACHLGAAKVVATCSHDTAAAVAAVPVESAAAGDWAYLSSGTWSLLGAESQSPVINAEAQRLNFTNEVGFGGTIRLLKNIVGLWPLQECRREWKSEGKAYSYDELTQLAAGATPLRSILDLTDPRFLLAGDMLKKVSDFCRETGQPIPETPAGVTRCILESLALAYRRTLAELSGLLGRRIERLHIVGGGSRNAVLNQMSADACGVTVVAGPVEATGVGNALVQGIALGVLPNLPAARELVRRSFPLQHYQPLDTAAWDDAADRLTRIQAHRR